MATRTNGAPLGLGCEEDVAEAVPDTTFGKKIVKSFLQDGPEEGGTVPATGAVATLIPAATGVQPYYIGKPNPLMFRNSSTYTTGCPLVT